jgi:hypothetical protein
MSGKKPLGLALVLLFIMQFACLASASYLDEVAVQYNGSWQWWVDQYDQPTLQADSGGKSFSQNFDFDIDEPSERTLAMNYLGQSYSIEILPSASGSHAAVFAVQRNGQRCGLKTESLPSLSNAIVDLSAECGLKIWANWEAITLETDVSIKKIWFSNAELNRAQNEFFKGRNMAEVAVLINNVARANAKFRALEKTSPVDFIEGELFFVHAKTEYFDEEDTTGKTKALVITDNLQVKYVVLLPEQWSTEFKAYKPTVALSAYSINDFGQLMTLLDSAQFEEVPLVEKSAEELQVTIENYSAAATAAGVATGATAALAKTGAITAAWYGSGLALGGSSLAGAVVATGGTILIVGAVAGAGYMAVEGTRTRTMVGDGGSLIFNYDREYLTFNEAKINFILLPKDFVAVSQAPDGWIGLSLNKLPAGTDMAKTLETMALFSDLNLSQKADFAKKLGSDGKTVYIKPVGLVQGLTKTYYLSVQPVDAGGKLLDSGGKFEIAISNLDIAKELEVYK